MTVVVAATVDWVGNTTVKSASSKRLPCRWNCSDRSSDTHSRVIFIPVTVGAVCGGVSGLFSGGDQRRCDRRPMRVLDLCSSSW